jgi:hypothetical protein
VVIDFHNGHPVLLRQTCGYATNLIIYPDKFQNLPKGIKMADDYIVYPVTPEVWGTLKRSEFGPNASDKDIERSLRSNFYGAVADSPDEAKQKAKEEGFKPTFNRFEPTFNHFGPRSSPTFRP